MTNLKQLLEEFDEKFTFGEKWKTHCVKGTPAQYKPNEVKQFLISSIKKFIEETRVERKEIVLKQPCLEQYEDRGSAPFYCSICGMSELSIMDNKTKDNKYFCSCSYWSDPHNAYVDKSGGKWLGWKNKEKTQKIVENYPYENNGYNQALKDIKRKQDKFFNT